ncbi:lysozyme C, milk isozyme-like [Paroedura picta]|uniref:lysozyme C, milk isozyme-like n=1 Tax=Paroedura picta TaxID=143630 RepID=UPI004055B9BE
MKVQLLAAFFFLLVVANEAEVLQRCQLVRILRNAGMDGFHGYSLANWICLADHESGYDTSAVGPPNWDGSRDYGIFQINSRWWCSNGEGRTADGCHTSCSSFLNNDISDDIACAKRIVQDPNGIGAWVAWRRYCKGRDLSQYVAGC